MPICLYAMYVTQHLDTSRAKDAECAPSAALAITLFPQISTWSATVHSLSIQTNVHLECNCALLHCDIHLDYQSALMHCDDKLDYHCALRYPPGVRLCTVMLCGTLSV